MAAPSAQAIAESLVPKSSVLNFNNLDLKDLPPVFTRSIGDASLTAYGGVSLKSNRLAGIPLDLAKVRALPACQSMRRAIAPHPLRGVHLVDACRHSPHIRFALLLQISARTCPCVSLCSSLRRPSPSSPPSRQVPTLRVIHLDDNRIATLPPLALFAHVQFLSLRRNRLTKLPPSVADLISLVVLDVSDNQLTRLPPELGKLSNLRLIVATGTFPRSLEARAFA